MADPDPRQCWHKQAQAGPSLVLCLHCWPTLTFTHTLLATVKCGKDQLKLTHVPCTFVQVYEACAGRALNPYSCLPLFFGVMVSESEEWQVMSPFPK